jgi:hypothetical protein
MHLDPDPGGPKTCGSGSPTLVGAGSYLILRKYEWNLVNDRTLSNVPKIPVRYRTVPYLSNILKTKAKANRYMILF